MKTESTAAEEHECEYKLIMETQNSNMKRLIADMAWLKEELASERNDRRAAASALYRTETQRDEAVENLELIAKITGAENVEKMLAGLSTVTPEKQG